MINRNKRDQEAWLREKNLESLKNNTFLQENDIVQVAENGNFYKVVTSETDIVLQNGLYAEINNEALKLPQGNFNGTAETLKESIDTKINKNGDTVTGTFNMNNCVAPFIFNTPNNQAQYNEWKKNNIRKIIFGFESSTSADKFVFNGYNNTFLEMNGFKYIKAIQPITFGEKIKAGFGSTEVIFSPEDNTRKAMKFYDSSIGANSYFDLKSMGVLDLDTNDSNNGRTFDISFNRKGVKKGEIGYTNGKIFIYNASSQKSIELKDDGQLLLPATNLSTPSKDVVGAINYLSENKMNKTDNIDASKITSGIISIDRIPKTAISDFVPVQNETARFALTNEQVQNGDTVKETDTGKMFLVINDTKLNTSEGYQEYTTVVDWSTITNKPSSLPNEHGLTIKLNGAPQTVYKGISPVEINITPASIKALDTENGGTIKNTVKIDTKGNNGLYLAKNGTNQGAFCSKDDGIGLWNAATGKFMVEARNNGEVVINGPLSGNGGNITGFGKVYNAVWNDYAEFFERGEETEPGDIIALDINSDKERYVKASNENPIVVGVHSNSFAHLIGGEEPQNGEDFFDYNIKKFIPVGLAGRVKVKVIGPVKKGDMIFLSDDIPGVGNSFKGCFEYMSAMVGIALENKTSEDIGLVKILIKH